MPTLLTNKSLVEGCVYLAARDNDLAHLLKTNGLPPLWARKPCFATFIHIILEQQVSLASAMAIYRRRIDKVVPFKPERVVEVGSSYLRSLGLTRQKATYCINLTEAILSNRLDIETVSRMDDVAAADTLTRIKGISPWTAGIHSLYCSKEKEHNYAAV